MKKLLFYTIDKEYINYLSKYETYVSYNKEISGYCRPYLGIVFNIENFSYFAPLYSYKQHYNKYKNNPTFFFIYNRKKRPISYNKVFCYDSCNY